MLYLSQDASGAQVAQTIALARSDPSVSRVRFISKRSAFAIMKERHPDQIPGAFNPLPAAIEITPARAAAAAAIAKRLQTGAAAGLFEARYSRC
jgi:cell division protein FtsX